MLIGHRFTILAQLNARKEPSLLLILFLTLKFAMLINFQESMATISCVQKKRRGVQNAIQSQEFASDAKDFKVFYQAMSVNAQKS